MKPIKLKIVDWWNNDFDNNFIVKILREKFDVIESKDPEYILYSVFGFEHIKYDCVRILFLGENIAPDFNVCDYAIGTHHISFEDRYLYYPLFFIYHRDLQRAQHKHEINDISHKDKFCNYIYSNKNAASIRGDFFEFLNRYKTVDSVGKDRNNMGKILPIEDNSKYNFMKSYKFSIAFENSSTSGYCTEKIIQAFAAATIPIYWGDKSILCGEQGCGINPKAFINIRDYSDFDDALNKIKELDTNDDKFINMLREKVFIDGYIERKNMDIRTFLENIFKQEQTSAYRRKNEAWYMVYNKNYIRSRKILTYIKMFNTSNIKKLIMKICLKKPNTK